MARKIATIQNEILSKMQTDVKDKNGTPVLTSPSTVAVYYTLSFIIATTIAVFEQIFDLFIVNSEKLIGTIPPTTGVWWAYMIKKFQYGDILLLDTDSTSPTYLSSIYAVPNTSKQIITRVSANRNIDGNIVIKVAKGTTTIEALTSSELQGLQAYANEISPLALVECYSYDPDLLAITGTFYIDGQYSATVGADIELAINNYLATISSETNFNGTLQVIDLEVALRAVAGVKDLVLERANARANAATYPGEGVDLVLAQTLVQRNYNSVAGYVNYDSVNSSITIIVA